MDSSFNTYHFRSTFQEQHSGLGDLLIQPDCDPDSVQRSLQVSVVGGFGVGAVLAGGSAAVTVPADDAEPPAAVVTLPADGQRGAADLAVSALQQPAGDHHSHRC